MTKQPTIYKTTSGDSIRSWATPTRWKSTDAWSGNVMGGGAAHVPGVRDRQGWETLPGGGRRKAGTY